MANQPPNPTARRMAVLIGLVAFLPPLGILATLRSTYTNARGKLLFSLLATVSMTIYFTFFLSGGPIPADMPQPSIPRTVGFAAQAVVPAAPNAQAPAASGDGVAAANPMGNPGGGGQSPSNAQNQSVTVYSVRENATLYHRTDECDGQINRRSLTLQEALDERLEPCSKCDPPQ